MLRGSPFTTSALPARSAGSWSSVALSTNTGLSYGQTPNPSTVSNVARPITIASIRPRNSAKPKSPPSGSGTEVSQSRPPSRSAM